MGGDIGVNLVVSFLSGIKFVFFLPSSSSLRTVSGHVVRSIVSLKLKFHLFYFFLYFYHLGS